MPINFAKMFGTKSTTKAQDGSVTTSYADHGGVGSVAAGKQVGVNNFAARNAQYAAQTANDKANKDSLAQYQKLLQQAQQTTQNVGSLYGQAQQSVQNVGDQAKQRAGQQNQQQLAQAQQSLISRGLGNTTVLDSANRGINSDYAMNLGDIDEQQARLRSGLLTQQAGAEMGLGQFNADAILSRQNVGPDLGMYTQLLQALAAGAY